MIESIRLENFKAFRNLQLGLGSLNVFAGANSSGKSTVLQAIGLLRQSLVIYPTGAALALNGEYVQLGTGRDVRHERWDDEGEYGGDVAIRLDSEGRELILRGEYVADSETLSIRDRPDTNQLLQLLGGRDFQYIRASRMSPATSYERSYRAVVEQNTLGAEGQFAVDYLRTHGEELRVASPLAVEGSRRNSLIGQTEAWLGRISPGANLNVAALEGTDSVRLAFQMGRTGLDSTNPYRPTNVGFGLAYVLPVIVACLTAKPGGLIVVENPEAHLHPAGQSAMGQLIALSARVGAQVLLETHSDHVLNAVRLAIKREVLSARDVKLQFFSRSEKGEPAVDQVEVNDSGSIHRWPRGFFDEFDSALLELTADD